MVRKKISQRAARWMQKRIEDLERERGRQRDRWASDWDQSWVNIETLTLSDSSYAKVKTARALKHAVIVLPAESGTVVRLYAERLP
jgi:hypothetical protein